MKSENIIIIYYETDGTERVSKITREEAVSLAKALVEKLA